MLMVTYLKAKARHGCCVDQELWETSGAQLACVCSSWVVVGRALMACGTAELGRAEAAEASLSKSNGLRKSLWHRRTGPTGSRCLEHAANGHLDLLEAWFSWGFGFKRTRRAKSIYGPVLRPATPPPPMVWSR